MHSSVSVHSFPSLSVAAFLSTSAMDGWMEGICSALLAPDLAPHPSSSPLPKKKYSQHALHCHSTFSQEVVDVVWLLLSALVGDGFYRLE